MREELFERFFGQNEDLRREFAHYFPGAGEEDPRMEEAGAALRRELYGLRGRWVRQEALCRRLGLREAVVARALKPMRDVKRGKTTEGVVAWRMG